MLDSTDRQLLHALQRDGRASISELANRLGLSRATVRTRLDRLIETGAIRRFTVEVGSNDESRIHAIVLIRLQGSMSRTVIRALSALAGIDQLHATNGAWDLVAYVSCESLRAFDQVLRAIREVPGVTMSESCLLLDRVDTPAGGARQT